MVNYLNAGIASALILGLLAWGAEWFLSGTVRPRRWAVLVAVLVLDLFSATMLSQQNFAPLPVGQRLVPPPYLSTLTDPLRPGERVEGLRGVDPGQSAAFGWADIAGNNPLLLDAVRFYNEQIPLERRWELLNVRVVNSAMGRSAGRGGSAGRGAGRAR
ncbi:MAG: hypothetical protein HC915_11090, partial [Anaerolineae bacterium]|nr:hypothetical protein [Anaerolineae bacterium]